MAVEIEGEPPIHYDAAISLRIRTSTIEPETISAELGIEAETTYRRGKDYRTSGGRVRRSRTTEENFWTARLSNITSPPDNLPAELNRQLDRLESTRELLTAVRNDGGTAEFFIGYFMRKFNTGDTFGPSLLSRLAELGIGVSFDIYDSKV